MSGLRGPALALLLVIAAAAAPSAATAPAPPARKPAPSAGKPEASAGELERLRRAAEEKRKLARQLKSREKSVLGQLRKSDEALGATRRYIQLMESRELAIQNEINSREILLEAARRELDVRRARLKTWMREAYVHGRARELEVMFSSSSFGDLLKRTYFVSLVMQEQRRSLEAFREQKRLVEEEKATLEARRGEIHTLRGRKEAERRHYQDLKETQKGEVARIRNERQSYEAAARELDAAAARMQKLLADLEEQRRRALRQGSDAVEMELDRNNFGANRGRLPWPAAGDLVGRFGLETHAKWGTQVRNNGIDIRAAEGSPVKCVGDGRVELADWLAGYGESVIVNHGQGYYSIYSHLASTSVKAGDRVSLGQTLGTVGDSGSLKGTCLHFEVRKGREAQNPEAWLR